MPHRRWWCLSFSGPATTRFMYATRNPRRQVVVLLSNLDKIKGDLDMGSIVTIEETRVRIRRLPIGSITKLEA